MAKIPTWASGLSPELAKAISSAAQKYGVSPGTLTGIWRIETGNKYPNPWANGWGYGGEFGTRMTSAFGSASDQRRITEPPIQQQADSAASTLASLIKQYGNESTALYHYSGRGYSSVAGQGQGGVFPGVGGVGPPPIATTPTGSAIPQGGPVSAGQFPPNLFTPRTSAWRSAYAAGVNVPDYIPPQGQGGSSFNPNAGINAIVAGVNTDLAGAKVTPQQITAQTYTPQQNPTPSEFIPQSYNPTQYTPSQFTPSQFTPQQNPLPVQVPYGPDFQGTQFTYTPVKATTIPVPGVDTAGYNKALNAIGKDIALLQGQSAAILKDNPVDQKTLLDYLPIAAQLESQLTAPALEALQNQGLQAQRSIETYNRGAMSELQQIPQQIASNYQQAENLQAGISQGVQQALQAQNPVASEEALGIDPAQMAQIRQQADTTYNQGGNVLGGVGMLGVSGLAQQEAAQKSFAQTLPGLLAIAAQQQLAGVQNSTQSNIASLEAEAGKGALTLANQMLTGHQASERLAQQRQNMFLGQIGKSIGLDQAQIKNLTSVYNTQVSQQQSALRFNAQRIQDVNKTNAAGVDAANNRTNESRTQAHDKTIAAQHATDIINTGATNKTNVANVGIVNAANLGNIKITNISGEKNIDRVNKAAQAYTDAVNTAKGKNTAAVNSARQHYIDAINSTNRSNITIVNTAAGKNAAAQQSAAAKTASLAAQAVSQTQSAQRLALERGRFLFNAYKATHPQATAAQTTAHSKEVDSFFKSRAGLGKPTGKAPIWARNPDGSVKLDPRQKPIQIGSRPVHAEESTYSQALAQWVATHPGETLEQAAVYADVYWNYGWGGDATSSDTYDNTSRPFDLRMQHVLIDAGQAPSPNWDPGAKWYGTPTGAPFLTPQQALALRLSGYATWTKTLDERFVGVGVPGTPGYHHETRFYIPKIKA